MTIIPLTIAVERRDSAGLRFNPDTESGLFLPVRHSLGDGGCLFAAIPLSLILPGCLPVGLAAPTCPAKAASATAEAAPAKAGQGQSK